MYMMLEDVTVLQLFHFDLSSFSYLFVPSHFFILFCICHLNNFFQWWNSVTLGAREASYSDFVS